MSINAEILQYIKEGLFKKVQDSIEQNGLKEACLIRDKELECITYFDEKEKLMDLFEFSTQSQLSQVNAF